MVSVTNQEGWTSIFSKDVNNPQVKGDSVPVTNQVGGTSISSNDVANLPVRKESVSDPCVFIKQSKQGDTHVIDSTIRILGVRTNKKGGTYITPQVKQATANCHSLLKK